MIDLTKESPLSLSEAGRLLPPGRRNKRPSLSCLLRWVETGIKSPTGELIRLEALRCGGRWLTSREALQRFALALTPRLDAPAAPAIRTPAQRRRSSERAEKILEKAGI
jgi:hypothetical protein